MRTFQTLAIAAILLGCHALSAAPQGGKYEPSVLRVRVTRQEHDFFRPWQKKPPQQVGGMGVVLGPDRILVPGVLLQNATLVEVERIGDGARCEATVECADYVANLGLIRPKDEAFAAELKPLRIREMAKRGDKVSAVQFEANGVPSTSEGVIKNAEIAVPPGARRALLVYQVSIELELGDTGITPFFRRGRLIGLMVAYDEAARIATLIPSPVIQHFLTDLEDGSYGGFPRAGFATSSIQDPQLRRYLGIEPGEPGVYVTQVLPGGPAAKAGMQEGDLLLELAGHTVDRHGQYEDRDYGPMALSHLIGTGCQAGDRIPCRIKRDGQELVLDMTMDRMDVEEFPVPLYVIDRPPRFLIEDGFVFQELSVEFLSMWGPDWRTKAPRSLTRLEREQWDRRQPGERFIIMTRVIPTPDNIGYQGMSFEVVQTVNDREVKSVRDVADAFRNAGPIQFHTVQLQDPSLPEIVIKAATLDMANQFVSQRYGIPHLSYLD
jgi:S1-C subfamily serine protease